MSQLENLTIANLEELTELCSSLGRLQAVKKLTINSCALTKLPDSFGKLNRLEKLEFADVRKLEELCSSFGELESLKELTLQSCALTTLPDSFGKLSRLEKLTLFELPQLEELCSSFGELESLKELTLHSCALTKLPDSFGKLSRLEKLTLLDLEHFEELCSSFGELESLKELTLHRCALTKLPDSFGKLSRLQHLTLLHNRLETYPRCTLSLVNLQVLDLSNLSGGGGNAITELPAELVDTNLVSLKLDGNPITKPPMAIWKQGIDAIKSFLKARQRFEWELMCADTINMIGDTEAGKSSLALSLVHGSPITAVLDDRTRVMQQLRMNLRSGLVVNVNDFGGHSIYHSVIPIFLPADGLVIVVYNLKDDFQEQKKQIKKWLLTTVAKSGNIRVVIVGTRYDLVSPVSASSELELQMKTLQQDILSNQVIEIDRSINKLKNSENIEKAGVKVACVSCTEADGILKTHQDVVQGELRELDESKNSEKLQTLKSNIENARVKVAVLSCVGADGTLKKLQDVVQGELKKLDEMPVPWCLVMQDILTADPKVFYLKMENVKVFYQNHVKDDKICSGLPFLLRYLVSSSQILWLYEDPNLRDFVFHSPLTIINVCKELLDHDQALMSSSEWKEAYKFEIEQYKKGILLEDLLVRLMSRYDHHRREVVVDFLKHFNLISEVKKHKTNNATDRTFIIPSILRIKQPEVVDKFEQDVPLWKNRVSLKLRFFGDILPLSLFETNLSVMMTAAYKLASVGPVVEYWTDGLFIQHSEVKFAAKRAENVVTLTSGSRIQKRSPWSILYPVAKALQENLTSTWAGAPPDCMVICPACTWRNKNIDPAGKNGELFIGSLEYLLSDGPSGRTTEGGELQSVENAVLTCGTCYAGVPRTLCFPVSRDLFNFRQIQEIEAFYRERDDERTHKIRPGGEPLLKRRKFSEPGSPKESGAGLSESGSEVRFSRKQANYHKRVMETELQQRLRKLTAELAASLPKYNVQALATIMWSAEVINEIERDRIKSFDVGYAASTELVECAYNRGDKCILGLAKALREIELSNLADKLHPEGAGKTS